MKISLFIIKIKKFILRNIFQIFKGSQNTYLIGEKLKKMKYYEPQQTEDEQEQIGCGFCYDNRRKKDIELFFLDRANNMRVCEYCPYCGRPLT